MPRSNKDIPKSGDVSRIAGIKPISALINAVKTQRSYYFSYFYWRNK